MAPIIGGAVGAVSFVIALIGIAVVWRRRKKDKSGVCVRVERARARVRARAHAQPHARVYTCMHRTARPLMHTRKRCRQDAPPPKSTPWRLRRRFFFAGEVS